MKAIKPYLTFQEAIAAFDNGGHFYNLFCHAKDGVVSPAELGIAAGNAHSKQELILFLVMSLSKLDTRSKEKVLSRLDTELFEYYEKYRPVHMSLQQIKENGKPGISTTVVGYVKKISSNSELTGSIMVPVVVGTVTSFTMVPMENSYQMYELSSEYTDDIVMVAHPMEKETLPEGKLRIGGMLTSLKDIAELGKPDSLFLESQYYFVEE
jgi:hypothetical protein